MFDTPIILMIFKRPETTEQVFDVIRQIKPTKLLIIADGPRLDRLGEAEKCAATRAIVDRIDWDCEVLKNYSEPNLGCKKRVATGLTWAFTQVEEAIILEDDCVPTLTFFQFCQELLKRYRDDTRILSISGNNFLFGRYSTDYSYHFSRYCHVWGWATWRRAWQYFDLEMTQWEQVKQKNLLSNIFADAQSVQYWEQTLQAVFEGQIDTWDHQWNLASWLQSGLSIHPSTCLVANVGFSTEATNTSDTESLWANLPVQPMAFPLKHPPFMLRDIPGDHYTQKTAYETSCLQRVQTKIKKLLRASVS